MSPNSIVEPGRNIPVIGEYDVIVAGGGIAGVAAALAAARRSARVCIVERYCALGGLATLGNVTIWLPICDGRGRQVIAGLGEELLKLSVAGLRKDNTPALFIGLPPCWMPDGARDERKKHRYQVDFNPAAYLLLLEKAVTDAGVHLLYDTRLCTVRREANRISHVIVENKDGRSAIACKTLIDSTGDADVIHAAGEKTVSLKTNVLAGWFYTLADGELRLHQMSNRYCPVAGTEAAEGPFFAGDDAEDVTGHILQTRSKMRSVIEAMRGKNPDGDIQPIMPAAVACLRMTRRLAGRFTLSEKHMHRWFNDTIGLTGDWRRPGPVYAVPFGCLRPAGTVNLLAAGRCISVDSTAWDVLRAIPPCVVTGQAAGVAASLAAASSAGDLDALDGNSLRDALLEQGVLLDPSLVKPVMPDVP